MDTDNTNRQYALLQAVETSSHGDTAEQVVNRAETYLGFLTEGNPARNLYKDGYNHALTRAEATLIENLGELVELYVNEGTTAAVSAIAHHTAAERVR